jgi:chromosome partitioning protein
MAPPRVVYFINQKGGCGKSSLCFHLAGTFAECGLRVLLIDADPQGSLGRAFWGQTLSSSSRRSCVLPRC